MEFGPQDIDVHDIYNVMEWNSLFQKWVMSL